MRLRSAALTDIGQHRSDNEDRYLLDTALGLYGIADGIGGLPNGGEAAECATAAIVRQVKAAAPSGVPDLAQFVATANSEVLALGQELSPELGIGTTLTFGLIRADVLHLAHVGDSRCYVWGDGRMTQLSHDHNVECEAQRRRARGEVVYYHSSNRNALTRCIGQADAPEVDLLSRPLVAGERYLFCSDGVTRLVRDAELAGLLAHATTPEETLRELIDLANRRGGPDNATGVLLLVEPV
jgi:serine/threonine protein phosphatase PrpC